MLSCSRALRRLRRLHLQSRFLSLASGFSPGKCRPTHATAALIFVLIFQRRVDGYPGLVLVLFAVELPAAEGAGGGERAVLGAVVDASLFTPLGKAPGGVVQRCPGHMIRG